MAEKDDDSRYEHQFEDLNGAPDTDSDVDLGELDDDFELADEGDGAPRRAAGDEDAGEGDGGGQGGDDDPDLDAEIEAELRRAREAQGGSERDQAMEAMRAELDQLRESQRQAEAERQASQASAEIEREITDARAALARAQEEGDTEAAVQAQETLVDLRVRKAMAAAPAAEKPNEDGDRETGRQTKQEQSRQQPPASAPEIPEAARNWLASNRWYIRGENPEARDTVGVIEKQLVKAGMNPREQGFYDALDKRLQKFHPELSGAKPRKSRGNGPTNGMGADGPSGRGGRVQITADDKAAMRQFGLDPDDKEHLKAWAREKRSGNEQRR